jgi:hypothetical protein
METKKDKKDQIFISFVITGVLVVVVSNFLSTNSNFTILATQSTLFALVMYGIFYGIPTILLKLNQWMSAPRNKNINLNKRQLENGNLVLELINNEFRKSAVWVNKLQIADNPLSWFPISGAGFSIKPGDSKEIFYMKWDKLHRYFSIADFDNNDYKKVYGVGVYKFDIAITYGFSEKEKDRIKRFSAIVSFEENGIIRIVEMKHSD